MNIAQTISVNLTPAEWESLMAICLVAYESDKLDLQDIALAERIIISGGGELEEIEESESSIH